MRDIIKLAAWAQTLALIVLACNENVTDGVSLECISGLCASGGLPPHVQGYRASPGSTALATTV